MPQGRKKVPFSAKQKKQQLQQKREKKRDVDDQDDDGSASGRNDAGVSTREASQGQRGRSAGRGTVNRMSQQPQRSRGIDPNKYRLQFFKETKEDLAERKRLAGTPIVNADEESLEVDTSAIFLPNSELDMPKRPQWDYAMSKHQLENQENRYFLDYVAAIEKKFSPQELSYFELNLETWRQLWRVLEMSDIILVIVDIRFPPMLFSPALYNHVTVELKRDVILVLNKIDLAPPSLVVAWKHYFLEKFPSLNIVCFTSFPGSPVKEQAPENKVQKKTRRGRLRMAAEGAMQILDICEKIVANRVDLSAWKHKIVTELDDDDDEGGLEGPVTYEKPDTHFQEYQRFQNKTLTIGCLGQPNVGKSSLMNALVGKKVVSVSRTPGHTKHFQTIFLTENVRLCDCPGLVFPSKVPKPLQVLAGSYPIAQLSEPYSSIRFLAEHIPLVKLLKLRHPNAEDNVSSAHMEWSPLDICEAWAVLRGFKTARAARNDTYRAANHLLRMALEGRLCLCLRPNGYSQNKVKWENHEEIMEISKIIARKKQVEELEVAAAKDESDVDESSEYTDEGGSEEEDVEGEIEENDGDEDDDHGAADIKKVPPSDKKHHKPLVCTNKFSLLLE